MARDQPDLVAEPEPACGGRDGEPAVLVRGALIGRRGLVANQRRGGIGPSASVGCRPFPDIRQGDISILRQCRCRKTYLNLEKIRAFALRSAGSAALKLKLTMRRISAIMREKSEPASKCPPDESKHAADDKEHDNADKSIYNTIYVIVTSRCWI